MKLSVVIPAYNEEENIVSAVNDVFCYFPEAEVIVINDASTDNTLLELLKYVKRLDPRFIKNLSILTNDKNMGHGYSVVKGLKAATGDYILYIDADRQIGLENFSAWGAVVSGIRVHRSDKLFRKIVSFCLKTTIFLRYGYFVRDANCPFKIYKRSSIRPLLKELPTTYIVPIACLEVLARKHKLSVASISTPHRPYQGVRQGKLQSINKVSIKFFWSAFREMIQL